MKNTHFFIFLLGVSRLALAFGPMSEGMGSRILIKCRFSFFGNEKSVIRRRNLLLCFARFTGSHHRPRLPDRVRRHCSQIVQEVLLPVFSFPENDKFSDSLHWLPDIKKKTGAFMAAGLLQIVLQIVLQ